MAALKGPDGVVQIPYLATEDYAVLRWPIPYGTDGDAGLFPIRPSACFIPVIWGIGAQIALAALGLAVEDLIGSKKGPARAIGAGIIAEAAADSSSDKNDASSDFCEISASSRSE